MSKPWEENWRQEGSRYVERRSDYSTVAEIHPHSTQGRDSVEIVRFIGAAPYMARALQRIAKFPCAAVMMSGSPCAVITPRDDCVVCQARAALAKAGVPLP